MYILQGEFSFDSAHFLKDYNGKCGNLHGHRWRVVVRVQSNNLQENGQERDMVLDFNVFKKDLKNLEQILDHKFIYEKNSISNELLEALRKEGFYGISINTRPTAEALSKYIFEIIKDYGYNVKDVTVYETPNNCVTYTEENCKCKGV